MEGKFRLKFSLFDLAGLIGVDVRNHFNGIPRLTVEKGEILDEILTEPFTVQSVFEFQGPMGIV